MCGGHWPQAVGFSGLKGSLVAQSTEEFQDASDMLSCYVGMLEPGGLGVQGLGFRV